MKDVDPVPGPFSSLDLSGRRWRVAHWASHARRWRADPADDRTRERRGTDLWSAAGRTIDRWFGPVEAAGKVRVAHTVVGVRLHWLWHLFGVSLFQRSGAVCSNAVTPRQETRRVQQFLILAGLRLQVA